MTFDEYFKETNGKSIDFDGAYGVQCFDLVNDYVVKCYGNKPLTGNFACDIYENFNNQPDHEKYTRIANSPEFIPRKGDIVVWGSSLNGEAGHCAIATGVGTTSYFESLEQNWTGNNDPATVVRHNYDHVLGVLRPNSLVSVTKVGDTNKKGIDVSRHQEYPDYSKVAKDANVDFVIAQLGFGKYASQRDTSFDHNYKMCKQYGIPIGAYWFSYAGSVEEAKQEAKACLENLKGLKLEYPVFFDIEGSALSGDISGKCKAFCSVLENAGWFTGIYISRSPAQSYLDDYCKNNYALWLAEYNTKLNWSGPVGIWQNSSRGRIYGINGDVDTDVCYVDYPSLIKAGGFNGFEPSGKEVMDYSGFKFGDKNDGVLAYKQLLILARLKGIIKQKVDNNNSFGVGTEKATNEFLGLLDKFQNGIAGPNTIKALGEKLKEDAR